MNMKFTVTILGCGSALPMTNRYPSAQLVSYNNSYFLVDCAEGTQMQLRRQKVPFGKINNIFISHLHGDHYFGLFGLLSSLHLMGRKVTLNLFAPKQLQHICETVLAINGDYLGYNINFVALDKSGKRKILSDKHLDVFSFPVQHGIDTFGFLFVEKPKPLNIIPDVIDKYGLSISEIVRIKQGQDIVTEDGKVLKHNELTFPPSPLRSYMYCTDTLPLPDLHTVYMRPDLLYHEATFSSELEEMAAKTFHSTARQAAEAARRIEAKQLVIGHFSSRFTDTEPLLNEACQIFPNTIAAYDNLSVDIECN